MVKWRMVDLKSAVKQVADAMPRRFLSCDLKKFLQTVEIDFTFHATKKKTLGARGNVTRTNRDSG